MTFAGGQVTPLGAGPVGELRSFAIGPNFVAWCSDSNPAILYTTPLAGGAATAVATQPEEGLPAHGVAVDDANVYWTGWTGVGANVFKAPVGGGSVTMIASAPNTPMAIVVDATSVYWLEVGVLLPGGLGTPPPGQPGYMPGTGAVMKIAK